MRRLRVLLIALGLLILATLFVDTSGGRWSPDDRDTDRAETATVPARSAANSSIPAVSAAPGPVPEIPDRHALRICCNLGFGMRVSMAGVPIPIVEAGAVLEVDHIRQHHYDGGGMPAEFLSVVDEKLGHSIPDIEQNGLLYTCRGGFVDTSHIRELVDWTAFFFSKFDRSLETGAVIELDAEGAKRTVISQPVPSELIERLGRDRLVLTMAQWTAYQTSIWHETAQWYGFSIWALYPETASGFSPEDPFANAIGISLLADLDVRAALQSSDSFNRGVEAVMLAAVRELEPLPRDVTMQALEAVDGVWWDSSVRIPGKRVVIRREFDILRELTPWLLPDRYASTELRAALREACGANPKAKTLRVPESLGGVAMRDLVKLEITLDGTFSELPAFAGLDRFDQEYFPEMVAKVREANRIEFGEGSDRPD